MDFTEKELLKALAILTAMGQYKGDRNDGKMFIHCQMAVEFLTAAVHFGENAQSATDGESRAHEGQSQLLSIAQAAKLLGLYLDEPADFPGGEWIEKIEGEWKKNQWGGWWGRFSKN